MPRLNDLPKFVHGGNYNVTTHWNHLALFFTGQTEGGHYIDPDPWFQRPLVWTRKQQVAYLEYVLQEGIYAKTLYWNHPAWSHPAQPYCNLDTKTLVLVDGKQRLYAVKQFLSNKLRVFGHYLNEYEDHHQMRHYCSFQMHVNNLQTRAELLRWYLAINAGGKPHSRAEIERVRGLLREEEDKER